MEPTNPTDKTGDKNDKGIPQNHAVESSHSSARPKASENSAAKKPDEQSSTPFFRKALFWVATILVALIAIIFYHQHKLALKNQHQKPPLSVVVATATTSDIPVYLSALGTVTPTYSVTVKTEVTGPLLNVYYKEGQDVKTGDLLVLVDPAPFKAAVEQFQGQLARDQALLANAKVDLDRFQHLYKLDSVSQQVLQTQQSLVQQLEGTVKLDQGQLDGALDNLDDCSIRSPINGRVGLRLVDPGNIVQPSDTTGIAIINTVNPITVVFTIPEDNIPQVMQQYMTGKPLIVQAYDRTQNQLLATGTLLTIDNQIDPTTGTVKLKAQFPNNNDILFPNQFVNVQLLVNTLHNAVIIPTAAVQQGAQGSFVYLLNTDSTVSVKPIKLGITYGDNTVVNSGLTPREIVVTEGADKLTDGATVSVFNGSQNLQNAPTDIKKHGKHHRSIT